MNENKYDPYAVSPEIQEMIDHAPETLPVSKHAEELLGRLSETALKAIASQSTK